MTPKCPCAISSMARKSPFSQRLIPNNLCTNTRAMSRPFHGCRRWLTLGVSGIHQHRYTHIDLPAGGGAATF